MNPIRSLAMAVVVSGCGLLSTPPTADEPGDGPADAEVAAGAEDAAEVMPDRFGEVGLALDFRGLPAPFDQGFTAAASFPNDTMVGFLRDAAVVYGPVSGESAVGPSLSAPIDAALRFNEATLMLFSGRDVYLIDIETATMADADDLATLGLPDSWDRVDAAAVYDDTRWILFRRSEFVMLELPTESSPKQVVGPGPLSSIGLEDWSDGIDAAVNLLDGRIVFFRGDGFMVLDTAQNAITPAQAFAPAATQE